MSRECGRNIAGSQTGGRGWEISEGVKIHEHKNTDDNKNLLLEPQDGHPSNKKKCCIYCKETINLQVVNG